MPTVPREMKKRANQRKKRHRFSRRFIASIFYFQLRAPRSRYVEFPIKFEKSDSATSRDILASIVRRSCTLFGGIYVLRIHLIRRYVDHRHVITGKVFRQRFRGIGSQWPRKLTQPRASIDLRTYMRLIVTRSAIFAFSSSSRVVNYSLPFYLFYSFSLSRDRAKDMGVFGAGGKEERLLSL